jgi:AraC-like DNA-binding protein
MATADPVLHALLRDVADGQLAALPVQASPLDDVAGAIAALLPGGEAQIARVARTLGIGTRTLQRRLIARGATFRGLLNTVRHERATRELVESDRPITEIASRLGYAAPSELTRAFQRWTGMGPAAYRRAHRRV